MKAEPRRRSHTIGSKWLRQGSAGLGINTAEKTDSMMGNSEAENYAGIKIYPSQSGTVIDTVMAHEKEGNLDNIVSHNIKDTSNKPHPAGNKSKGVLEGEEILNDGLIVLDPKRRRIDE